MDAQPRPVPRSRARLAAVLRAATDGVISVDIAATTLGLERPGAAKTLSAWCHQGWLRRVGRGLYVAVPLELAAGEQVVADPWTLVPALFGRCYIGGWTAAHHWELTEQLFNEHLVLTTRRVVRRRVVAQGAAFQLRHVPVESLFGLDTLWRASTRVRVSDAARTLIDMLASPEIGGGMDHVADCVATFMASRREERRALVPYGERLGNGAVFKRLGYLAESRLRDAGLAAACRTRLTQGYAKLDPAMKCDRLVTAWRLWVPSRWRSGTS